MSVILTGIAILFIVIFVIRRLHFFVFIPFSFHFVVLAIILAFAALGGKFGDEPAKDVTTLTTTPHQNQHR
jgi:hypothetical protein